MSTTIAETFDRERMRAGLTAGAATVGRPTGVEGKNRTPRRAKMTSKEVDHIKTRAGIKAGGPGSGRKASGVINLPHRVAHQSNHNKLVKADFKFKNTSYAPGTASLKNHPTQIESIYEHPTHGKIVTNGNGDWEHYSKGSRIDHVPDKGEGFKTDLKKHLSDIK